MSHSYWFLSTIIILTVKILEFDYYVSVDKIYTYNCMITGIYSRQVARRGSPYNKRGVKLDLMVHVYTLQIYVVAMTI